MSSPLIEYTENGNAYGLELFVGEETQYLRAWNARKQTPQQQGTYEGRIVTKNGATYDEEAGPLDRRKVTLAFTDKLTKPEVIRVERP